MVTQLTPHFTLDELIFSQTATMRGIDNTPSNGIKDNLGKLALVLEKIRGVLGHPIHISSGFRCSELNSAIGGVSNSAHLYGLAADILCPDFGTPLEVCEAIKPHMDEFGIDQLIYEFKSWTHVGLSKDHPREMSLTIDEEGTRLGIA